MDKAKLQEELKKSMLERNEQKTSVLRLLLSALNYYEIQKGGAGYSASPEDVLTIIQKEAKQRRDSIEEYKKANRDDLADKEQEELDILSLYMPEMMSEDEIRKIVKEKISETGATSFADMGKVMASLMPVTKGKADGSIVSRIVKEQLSS